MIMNYRILFLVLLLCTAAVPSMSAAGEYMGGDVVLGGSGPLTITVTGTAAAGQGVPAAVSPATGSVSVATSPRGASISIDGVERGISPATIPGLSPGSHTLLVKMEGYQDLSVPVTVVQGETRDYALVLTPLAGAGTQAPAQPGKTPGFEAVPGLAALATVFVLLKRFP